MSMLIDEPVAEATHDAAHELRTTTCAVRLSVRWLGVRKTLTPQQKSQAADTFGAEGEFLSAGKKLIDTRHPAFKAVTASPQPGCFFLRGMTLPYPDPGIRLIRQDRIEEFDSKLHEFQQELNEAVWQLEGHYDELRSAARQRLGSLFNAADYPGSLEGMFGLEHDFPSVEPPDYLRQLHPDLYERECERVRQRFDQAVELAEQAFLEELSKLVSHLGERLSGQDDGKPKVFRDTAVTNLTEFFQRFRQLNINSNQQLDEVVDQAQQMVAGIQPQSLRENHVLRQSVAQELSQVQTVLDDLLVDRPRRNILRNPR